MSNVLLVAGSRDLIPDFDLLDSMVYCLDTTFDTVIHGGARGVDDTAGRWARESGVGSDVVVYPADWERWGKSAGYRRNVEMAEACTHAIIVWDGESKGTKHMIDLLIARQKPFVLRVARD